MKHSYVILFFIASFFCVPPVSAFSDVPSTHIHAEAINYLKQKNIIQGYKGNTFRPDSTITRAEFLKIAYLAATGFNAKEFEEARVCRHNVYLSDVYSDDWFHVYLCSAGSFAVSGYPDGTFRPLRNVNFAEGAKMIMSTMQIEKQHLSTPRTGDVPWYKKYVVFLEREGAIPPQITNLNQELTRGQMAEIMYRLMLPKERTIRTYEELTGESVQEAEYDRRIGYDYLVNTTLPKIRFFFYPETGDAAFVAPPNERMVTFDATYSSTLLRESAAMIAADPSMLDDFIVIEDIDNDGKNEFLIHAKKNPDTYTVWKYALNAFGKPWMTFSNGCYSRQNSSENE
jgi:hypothetical protein